MSRSEFRWNKKRKHYAYLHKDIGIKRKNILISSKPFFVWKGKIAIINIPLFRHPNPKYKDKYYLIPRNYVDNLDSFETKVYIDWFFDRNDKRKVKRIKKNKQKRKAGS